MKRLFEDKLTFLTLAATAAGWVSAAYGGWDHMLTTLVICMGVDYLSGTLVAAFWHKSPKSTSGGLESKAGWKGLWKKGMTMLVVLICCRLDLAMGTDYIRDAAIGGFLANELLSITENAGLMGLPLPAAVVKAVDVLQKKGAGK